MGEHSLDENIFVYLKLFLLYADDTIILADSAEKLQFALNIYASYCEDWRLLINYSKTKIIIFSKGKQTEYHFTLDSNTIEIVKEYRYLGVLFSKIILLLPLRNILQNRGHVLCIAYYVRL